VYAIPYDYLCQGLGNDINVSGVLIGKIARQSLDTSVKNGDQNLLATLGNRFLDLTPVDLHALFPTGVLLLVELIMRVTR